MPNSRLTTTARHLRRNQTDAEKLLWSRLRNRQLEDAKFVRQFPIGPFVVDFACRSLMLAVELDGEQHAENPRDAERTRVIEVLGYRIIRFWNNDVLSNPEGVLQCIAQEVRRVRSAPHPDPLPKGRGGKA